MDQTQVATISISTVEVIRAAWPIVVGLVLSLLYIAAIHHRSVSTQASLKSFKEDEYTKDLQAIDSSIKDLRRSQERSEEKIEQKLDKMNQEQLKQADKIYQRINDSNMLLSELKGRIGGGGDSVRT